MLKSLHAMRPARIILVRHGQSEGNAEATRYENVPDYALTLTPAGVEQGRRAGYEIRQLVSGGTVRVYLSPYCRTRQTYDAIREGIQANVVDAFEDPRLREQDWGHLRSPSVNEDIVRKRDAFSTFYYRIPDGESGADVYDRVTTFLETLHRDFQEPDYPDNALIVTHGMTLRLFLMRWFHWTVEEFENIRNPRNCQLVVMEREASGYYALASDLARRESTT